MTSFINTKCPIIIRLHGSDTYFCHLEKRPVKAINRLHEKKALQNADAIVSVSQFTADLTNKLFDLQRDIAVIPNAVDANQFNGKPSFENNTILYFGSLIRKKGLLELPLIFNEVIRTNPATKLILVGKDVPDIFSGEKSTWEMMQPLFTPEALKNVNYKGAVPFEEVSDYIEKAAICVFPSFAEALPVSWIEAMAMRKAIVASNIGWAKELITDGAEGFLANPENHKDFALKIKTLLDNPELMTTFGNSARKKVETEFATQVILKKNIRCYQKITNRNDP
ncbi:glycosyltransferase family 4 protein [Flavobacterium sp. 3HN19-14]|uniref:glycosyltransferase family 4 protein n=1 Tax=Flavobacterium sp. 3HN19-14 TaxID=3448133 RepID=UPI003EE3534B